MVHCGRVKDMGTGSVLPCHGAEGYYNNMLFAAFSKSSKELSKYNVVTGEEWKGRDDWRQR